MQDIRLSSMEDTKKGQNLPLHLGTSKSYCLGLFGLFEQNPIYWVSYEQQKLLTVWKSKIRHQQIQCLVRAGPSQILSSCHILE
jgi:hypothetical protein